MRFTDLTGLNKNINEFLTDSRAQKSMVCQITRLRNYF